MSDVEEKRKNLDYSGAFQSKMVRALYQDPGFAVSVGAHLDPNLFDGKVRRWLAGVLLSHARRHGSGASLDAVRIKLRRDLRSRRLLEKDVPEAEALIARLEKPIADRSFVKEELFRFTQNQVFKDIVKKSLVHLNDNDMDAIRLEFERYFSVSAAGSGGRGHFYVGDSKKRLDRREKVVKNGVPTGLKLDQEMRPGGLWPKALGCVLAPVSRGKCLEIGTKVLRYDGRRVAVEDVRVGDLLMGPDSSPRRVVATTRGVGPLYRVVPKRGRSWVCNDAHVLTVVSDQGVVKDVPLEEWIRSSKNFRSTHKQFSVGVVFPKQDPLPVDPYFLGLWFGDGSKDLGTQGVVVTKPGAFVKEALSDEADRWGLRIHEWTNASGCPSYRLANVDGKKNDLLDAMRSLVGPRVRVPSSYLTASLEDRKAFLAGWLDSDGHLRDGASYEITQRRKHYALSVAYLARSLGLFASVRPKKVQLPDWTEPRTYWRVSISGDFVSLRLPTRDKTVTRASKRNAARTSFAVEPVGVGEYAGFQLDGDGRFLLGDFTVTHNSMVLVHLGVTAILELGIPVLHVTLELSDEKIADRYDARFADVGLDELVDSRETVEGAIEDLGQRFGECLVVKEWPSLTLTVPMLRAYVRQLESEKFYPKLILVDYAAEMLPTISKDNTYEDRGNVFRELRKMAHELDVPVWTAAQTNKSGLEKAILDINMFAESYQQAMVSDVVVAVCQSPQEKRAGIGRLFVGKNREGRDKFEVPVKIDWARARLSDAAT